MSKVEWRKIPEGARVAQYRIGRFTRDPKGHLVRVVGHSTCMVKVRQLRWYERVYLTARLLWLKLRKRWRRRVS